METSLVALVSFLIATNTQTTLERDAAHGCSPAWVSTQKVVRTTITSNETWTITMPGTNPAVTVTYVTVLSDTNKTYCREFKAWAIKEEQMRE